MLRKLFSRDEAVTVPQTFRVDLLGRLVAKERRNKKRIESNEQEVNIVVKALQ